VVGAALKSATKAGPALKSVTATLRRCRVPLRQDFGMPSSPIPRKRTFHTFQEGDMILLGCGRFAPQKPAPARTSPDP